MQKSAEAPSDVFAASFLNAVTIDAGVVILRDQFSRQWDLAGVSEWATPEEAYAAVAAERELSVKTEPVRGTGELNDQEFLRLYLTAKPWPAQSRHAGKWCVVDAVGDPWAVRDVGVWDTQREANQAAMIERDHRMAHRVVPPPRPAPTPGPSHVWHFVLLGVLLCGGLWICIGL